MTSGNTLYGLVWTQKRRIGEVREYGYRMSLTLSPGLDRLEHLFAHSSLAVVTKLLPILNGKGERAVEESSSASDLMIRLFCKCFDGLCSVFGKDWEQKWYLR